MRALKALSSLFLQKNILRKDSRWNQQKATVEPSHVITRDSIRYYQRYREKHECMITPTMSWREQGDPRAGRKLVLLLTLTITSHCLRRRSRAKICHGVGLSLTDQCFLFSSSIMRAVAELVCDRSYITYLNQRNASWLLMMWNAQGLGLKSNSKE